MSLSKSCVSIVTQVSVEPVDGKKFEHAGVKIQLLGQIGEKIINALYHGTYGSTSCSRPSLSGVVFNGILKL